jgi:hypothetical protein
MATARRVPPARLPTRPDQPVASRARLARLPSRRAAKCVASAPRAARRHAVVSRSATTARPGYFRGRHWHAALRAVRARHGDQFNRRHQVPAVRDWHAHRRRVAGELQCKPCVKGSFASSTGTAKCELCRVGTAINSDGSSRCDECAVGRTTLSAGATECTLCAVGTFAGAMASPRCEPCAPGRRSAAEGQATCVECDAGTAQPLEGQSVVQRLRRERVCRRRRRQVQLRARSAHSRRARRPTAPHAPRRATMRCASSWSAASILRARSSEARCSRWRRRRASARSSVCSFLARSFFDEPVTNSSLVLAGLQVRVRRQLQHDVDRCAVNDDEQRHNDCRASRQLDVDGH